MNWGEMWLACNKADACSHSVANTSTNTRHRPDNLHDHSVSFVPHFGPSGIPLSQLLHCIAYRTLDGLGDYE